MKSTLTIIKILNNNAAVCKDSENLEKILMGRGLAFQQKVGATIDESLIEKIFVLDNVETSHRFQQLIQDIPVEHLLLSEKVISNAKQLCDKNLHSSIYITLSDHISAALERAGQGIILKNPMLGAIKRFYPVEYTIALQSLRIIKEETGLTFPDDEAGFMTMHFVTAELGAGATEFEAILSTIEGIAAVVKHYLAKEPNENALNWQRFITHISFFSQRLSTGIDYPDSGNAPLFEMVKASYPAAFECTKAVTQYVEKHFSCTVSNEEQTYLTMHIGRLQSELGIADYQDALGVQKKT